MTTESSPAPLSFPTDPEGWLAFAADRPEARIRLVKSVDARLIAQPELTTLEKLELWNDASIALAEARSASYVLTESHPEPAVRERAEEQIQVLESLAATRLLDRELWAVFAEADATGLDEDAQRLLQRLLRDFRRGGVDLDDDTRDRVRELTERDTQLSIAFSRNIREGRREITVAPDALAGLPQDFIDEHPPGDDGLVTLTTEYTDLLPVMEYASDRAVRHALMTAFNELAWPENDPVLSELLDIRAERARLLGFSDWADYETEIQMIGAGAEIPAFLARLDEASIAAARHECPLFLERLRRDAPEAEVVTNADYSYVLGALKRERYDVDAQEVRSYFAFDRVVAGILDVTGRLLDVEYVPADVVTWHADVLSYDVVREGARLGRIHLDLHPRDGKFNHAACFPLAPGIEGRVCPEAVLLCNFSRGLMKHDDVVTFFHEFGHLVHSILGGAQRWARFTGVATEWDFVEAPSQLLEEWAWDAGVLRSFGVNAAGEPIPVELVAKMRTADAFGRAVEARRQLGYAQTSYHLHVDRPEDLQAATEHWFNSVSLVKLLPGLHLYAGFGHLTGYGACYYTYEWSQVIARDLLSAFGDDLMQQGVARRYREEILEPGGRRDAKDLVEAFLGRPYAFDAYRDWLTGE